MKNNKKPQSEDVIAVRWATDTLISKGYEVDNSGRTLVKRTPWSYVVSFNTNQGIIYLKQTPSLLALEAQVILLLQRKFDAPVPIVIASDDELNCFLMTDVGVPLRQIFKASFDSTLMCHAVREFAKIQALTSNHIDVFLKIGVPDWRLHTLPEHYRKLIRDKNVLLQDGITEQEHALLQDKQVTIELLCKSFAGYAISPTIVQPDFHDNNLMIDMKTKVISAIDLGEIVIAHPYFSIVGCLYQLERHHGINIGDTDYVSIKHAYMESLNSQLSQQALDENFDAISVLCYLYSALAQYRLRLACDEQEFLSVQSRGKLCDALKRLCNALP